MPDELGLFGRRRERLERLDIRTHVHNAIATGRLPPEASAVLSNGEAFDDLKLKVDDLQSAAPVTGGTPSHPILAWLVQHAPQIEQFVQEILALFGINIHLPPLPGPTPVPPAPTPTPSPSPIIKPPPFNPPASLVPRANDGAIALPTIPPWLQQMLLQGAISAIQKALPQLQAELPKAEAALEAWLKRTFGD